MWCESRGFRAEGRMEVHCHAQRRLKYPHLPSREYSIFSRTPRGLSRLKMQSLRALHTRPSAEQRTLVGVPTMVSPNHASYQRKVCMYTDHRIRGEAPTCTEGGKTNAAGYLASSGKTRRMYDMYIRLSTTHHACTVLGPGPGDVGRPRTRSQLHPAPRALLLHVRAVRAAHIAVRLG